MLMEKWTPMNREITKFNSLVLETRVMSGENDENWMTRVAILYKIHTCSDFKHKSTCSFLKDKHKWKNSDSTNARRNRQRVTDEETELFGDDELSRPPDKERIAKSQRFSNSSASSVFLNNQLEEMPNHKRIYVLLSHTKKVFRNIKRLGKDFSGRVTPLFSTMLVQAQADMGKGSTMPSAPQHTPAIIQPTTSKPKKKQKTRKLRRHNTEETQPTGPTTNVEDGL
nr:hypothetical protein [Tanacetum cinerariifolium]